MSIQQINENILLISLCSLLIISLIFIMKCTLDKVLVKIISYKTSITISSIVFIVYLLITVLFSLITKKYFVLSFINETNYYNYDIVIFFIYIIVVYILTRVIFPRYKPYLIITFSILSYLIIILIKYSVFFRYLSVSSPGW
jgi:hypothetical protein